MIAKKPVAKPKTKPSEAKENKFIRASAAPSKNGHGEAVAVLLKVPSDLLDWLTAEAAKDGRARTVYMIRALQDHRAKLERGE